MSADETAKADEKNEINDEPFGLFEIANYQYSEVEMEVVSVINVDTGSNNDFTVVETRVKDVTNFTRLSGGLY